MTNKRGELRSFGAIAETLAKEGLHNLGLNIPTKGKVTVREAIMLNRVKKELPFMLDLAKADDIELPEITENVARST